MWCGAMGMAPLNSASASPGPSLATRRVGTPTICRGWIFNWGMQPRAGTNELVMTRPNPVRRGKSRPPVSSPRRSGRVDGFGPPTPAASSEAACARAAAKPCESKCRGIHVTWLKLSKISPEDGLPTLGAWMDRISRAPNPIIFGRLPPDIRRRTRSSSRKRRLTGCLTPSVQQGQAWHHWTAQAHTLAEIGNVSLRR